MSNPKNINLLDLFISKGMLFPTTPDQIVEFEKNFSENIKKEKPIDWENPLNIIKRGRINELKNAKIALETEAENLAMAARDGKEIPDEIRKKMIADRKNAK